MGLRLTGSLLPSLGMVWLATLLVLFSRSFPPAEVWDYTTGYRSWKCWWTQQVLSCWRLWWLRKNTPWVSYNMDEPFLRRSPADSSPGSLSFRGLSHLFLSLVTVDHWENCKAMADLWVIKGFLPLWPPPPKKNQVKNAKAYGLLRGNEWYSSSGL